MFGGLLPDSTLTGSLDVSFKSLLEVKCGQAKMVYYLLQQFVKINMVWCGSKRSFLLYTFAIHLKNGYKKSTELISTSSKLFFSKKKKISLTLVNVFYFLLRAFDFSLISNMTKILTMTVTVAIATFCWKVNSPSALSPCSVWFPTNSS